MRQDRQLMRTLGRTFTLVMLMMYAWLATAQEKTTVHPVDTLRSPNTIIDAKLFFTQPITRLPLSEELSLTPGYLSGMFFESSPAEGYFFSRREQQPVDLTGPLKLQLARQDRYSTMQAILGAVQVGGTVYLAYRYLKKHGLK